MLKYHVAVCDDEKSDLDGIVQSVQQYDVQGCFDIETYMDGNIAQSMNTLTMYNCSHLRHAAKSKAAADLESQYFFDHPTARSSRVLCLSLKPLN